MVRYWAASYSPGTDVIFSEDIFKNGKRLMISYGINYEKVKVGKKFLKR